MCIKHADESQAKRRGRLLLTKGRLVTPHPWLDRSAPLNERGALPQQSAAMDQWLCINQRALCDREAKHSRQGCHHHSVLGLSAL